MNGCGCGVEGCLHESFSGTLYKDKEKKGICLADGKIKYDE